MPYAPPPNSRAERAAQCGQGLRVEIGGHGHHGVDSFGDAQRAQMRVHFQRDLARGLIVAPQLAPVSQGHFIGTATRHGQRHASEARVAGHRLHGQRLVGDELAVARDGQGVVIEMQAVHGLAVRCSWES